MHVPVKVQTAFLPFFYPFQLMDALHKKKAFGLSGIHIVWSVRLKLTEIRYAATSASYPLSLFTEVRTSSEEVNVS